MRVPEQARLLIFLLYAILTGVLVSCGGGDNVEPGTTDDVSTDAADGSASGAVATLSLSGPALVTAGTYLELDWSSSNTNTCEASGAWSGIKPTSGVERIGPVTSSSTFNLRCTGTGGDSNASFNVTVISAGGSSIVGTVDSSYISQFSQNKIYIFSGNVTPDDIDGGNIDPISTVVVEQDAGTCLWRYSSPSLNPGTYTLAFTNQADEDNPQVSDAISFFGARSVVITETAVTLSNFRPTNILHVGPGKAYPTPSAANAIARSGDVIEIDAGVYLDDISVWRQNNLTLRGVGGKAHLRADSLIPYSSGNDRENGMGIWVIRGTGIKVENIEFSGATVVDRNGAGIRNQGRDLTICNSYFHDNENGILGGAYGTLLIEYSEFYNNGIGSYGRTHNLYIDSGDKLIFRYNYSHHATVGHNFKSRARENYILYNRIMDEADGDSSYAVDMPNGGLNYVIGNLIQQGINTNNSTLMTYGVEGLRNGGIHELYVINNTMINDRGTGIFIDVNQNASAVNISNNIFSGGGRELRGPGELISNLSTSEPGLVDISQFDYRLSVSSAARDRGTNPDSARGYDLVPSYQYVHKSSRQDRPINNQIDIGAYEYQP